MVAQVVLKEEAPPSRIRTVSRAPRGILALLSIVIIAIAVLIATFDLRTRPLVGDEASHVMQALSLAHDGDLSYDMGDVERFADMRWPGAEAPNSIIFQRYDHGFAFAKPYGFSLIAAPFVRFLGPFPGLATTSALLFLITVACAWVTCRPAGWAGGVFGTTSVLASVTWLYGFNAHSDLFLAALMSSIAATITKTHQSSRMGWLYAAGGLSAFALAEKPPFAVVLFPVLIITAMRRSSRRAELLKLVGVVGAVLALAVMPYLIYSNFRSWNPYAGQRYFRPDGVLPFTPGAPPLTDYQLVETTDSFSPSVVLDQLTESPAAGMRSISNSFVGRYTGMLAFLPMTLIALVLGARRGRRSDGLAIATVAGVVAYVVLYAAVFPKNYFGGEQSLGDRYLLQVSPIALLAIGMSRPPRRLVASGALLGTFLAVLFLGTQFRHPTDAFVRVDRSSPARALLPEERHIVGTALFRCGIPAVMWRGFDSPGRSGERIGSQETCLRIASAPPPGDQLKLVGDEGGRWTWLPPCVVHPWRAHA